MATAFNIQDPYVLITLPRPLNQNSCLSTYKAGEVWGQLQGSKKRKRSELAVGIDGEAVNIYDVPLSSVITSYPVPPQAVFTCPPCSTRWRAARTKDVSRYTYISTRDPKPRITLFKDVIGASGESTSTSVSEKIGHLPKLIHLSTTTRMDSADTKENNCAFDLVAVAEDGTITCFHGHDLRQRWQTSPEILLQDLATLPRGSDLRVELVQAASSANVISGIFGGNKDAFATFLQMAQDDNLYLDILAIITRSPSKEFGSRHLHILGIVPDSTAQVSGRLVQIHISSIPSPPLASSGTDSLHLDIGSGSLVELRDNRLITYDLTSSVVNIVSELHVQNVKSILRLSKSSLLAAESDSLRIYNPIFQSVQASATISLPPSIRDPNFPEFSLVAYFGRLEMAVALCGASLVAVQLEGPRARGSKRRAEGLLIDSLGRGIIQHGDGTKKQKIARESLSFSKHLPGTMMGNCWSEFTTDVENADAFWEAGDLAGFEDFLAGKFGIQTRPASIACGEEQCNDSKPKQKQAILPKWTWPATRSEYRLSDRRWIFYAIARIFAWRDTPMSGTDQTRLICKLPESNLLNYIIDAGHLTISNIKSALKDDLRGVDDVEYMLGEEIPRVLVRADPLFELLLSYLSSNKLGAVELLTAIRLIMRSLELVQEPREIAPPLQTFDAQRSGDVSLDENLLTRDQSAIGHELDRLEQELEVTECYLGEESDVRTRGLSVAFGKLDSCSRMSIVRTLRRGYKAEEILSLIYVLRMELVKDGWTTRYLDSTRLGEDEELEAPPDGSLSLLADLLCRCIDAVGPGGWLINDAIVAAGPGGHMDLTAFLASLKLETSAALEGVQEAAFLRGIISEVVRYGKQMQKMEQETTGQKLGRGNSKALMLLGPQAQGQGRATGGNSAMLPLGMKAKGRISAEKIISGGEVVRRRRREVGQLISLTVGAYSFERICI